jgi:hypothetical protein
MAKEVPDGDTIYIMVYRAVARPEEGADLSDRFNSLYYQPAAADPAWRGRL